MKILVVCQYYYPEPFRLNDICEELVNRGHQVTVLTGVPNYPMGKIYKGYEKGKKREEDINGVHVIRTWTYPRGTGTVKRILNYFSYPISAWFKAEKLEGDYDVVLVNQQSPVMMAWPGIRYGRKYKKPVVMYCMDLWPASLVAGGIGMSSLIAKFFHAISKNCYCSMDKILVTSRMFKGYLRDQFGIEESKMDSLPQYAEGIFEYLEPRKPDGTINLVFAGNIGTAQSMDTVIDAATKLPEVAFHIVGDGVELNRLKVKAGENVKFYGRQPLEDMPKFYALADAMIVSLQADSVLSLTLPGKVQSYMAVGRPIIGVADGETKATIEEAQCGYCGKAENMDELVENIRRFVVSKDKEQLGKNARKYYEEHFMRSRFMDKLERELQSTKSWAG